jgi:hypothetical protein
MGIGCSGLGDSRHFPAPFAAVFHHVRDGIRAVGVLSLTEGGAVASPGVQ